MMQNSCRFAKEGISLFLGANLVFAGPSARPKGRKGLLCNGS